MQTGQMCVTNSQAELSIKAGWWDAPLALPDLAEAI